MGKINGVRLETPIQWACDVHCYRHPPVAEVVKVPMIARRYTEHRNYSDSRHGTIHRKGSGNTVSVSRG
jgi:hypothetical protein